MVRAWGWWSSTNCPDLVAGVRRTRRSALLDGTGRQPKPGLTSFAALPVVALAQAGLLFASFDQEAFHLGAKRSFKFVLPNSNDAPAAAAQFA